MGEDDASGANMSSFSVYKIPVHAFVNGENNGANNKASTLTSHYVNNVHETSTRPHENIIKTHYTTPPYMPVSFNNVKCKTMVNDTTDEAKSNGFSITHVPSDVISHNTRKDVVNVEKKFQVLKGVKLKAVNNLFASQNVHNKTTDLKNDENYNSYNFITPKVSWKSDYGEQISLGKNIKYPSKHEFEDAVSTNEFNINGEFCAIAFPVKTTVGDYRSSHSINKTQSIHSETGKKDNYKKFLNENIVSISGKKIIEKGYAQNNDFEVDFSGKDLSLNEASIDTSMQEDQIEKTFDEKTNEKIVFYNNENANKTIGGNSNFTADLDYCSSVRKKTLNHPESNKNSIHFVNCYQNNATTDEINNSNEYVSKEENNGFNANESLHGHEELTSPLKSLHIDETSDDVFKDDIINKYNEDVNELFLFSNNLHQGISDLKGLDENLKIDDIGEFDLVEESLMRSSLSDFIDVSFKNESSKIEKTHHSNGNHKNISNKFDLNYSLNESNKKAPIHDENNNKNTLIFHSLPRPKIKAHNPLNTITSKSIVLSKPPQTNNGKNSSLISYLRNKGNPNKTYSKPTDDKGDVMLKSYNALVQRKSLRFIKSYSLLYKIYSSGNYFLVYHYCHY